MMNGKRNLRIQVPKDTRLFILISHACFFARPQEWGKVLVVGPVVLKGPFGWDWAGFQDSI
jgi:hypothetical protein